MFSSCFRQNFERTNEEAQNELDSPFPMAKIKERIAQTARIRCMFIRRLNAQVQMWVSVQTLTCLQGVIKPPSFEDWPALHTHASTWHWLRWGEGNRRRRSGLLLRSFWASGLWPLPSSSPSGHLGDLGGKRRPGSRGKNILQPQRDFPPVSQGRRWRHRRLPRVARPALTCASPLTVCPRSPVPCHAVLTPDPLDHSATSQLPNAPKLGSLWWSAWERLAWHQKTRCFGAKKATKLGGKWWPWPTQVFGQLKLVSVTQISAGLISRSIRQCLTVNRFS